MKKDIQAACMPQAPVVEDLLLEQPTLLDGEDKEQSKGRRVGWSGKGEEVGGDVQAMGPHRHCQIVVLPHLRALVLQLSCEEVCQSPNRLVRTGCGGVAPERLAHERFHCCNVCSLSLQPLCVLLLSCHVV